ncbi:hypothetical protein FHQ28_05525 [Pasteurellaceae bacterium USgator11]|nr:hypothetical protein FHQ20_07785 [Pasteurellaceae bacterium USgator41]TNG96457.1 hypothetical protein FHQ19_01960 [Pasteurellaceae bacterium UScroc12]TNH00461.1 hypothetical protein FHQ24_03665 [Pasteurellaceae bacterium UScroc31]TNH01708.1 hypothetical protein FHQ28_05525 [Pasteurellaceae bacterium USgator11]
MAGMFLLISVFFVTALFKTAVFFTERMTRLDGATAFIKALAVIFEVIDFFLTSAGILSGLLWLIMEIKNVR